MPQSFGAPSLLERGASSETSRNSANWYCHIAMLPFSFQLQVYHEVMGKISRARLKIFAVLNALPDDEKARLKVNLRDTTLNASAMLQV